MDVLRLAEIRQGTYQLLGAMLLYPEELIVAAVPEAARHLLSRGRPVASLAFYSDWERFLRCVEGLASSGLRELQQEYLHLFSGTASDRPVSLCESGYMDPVVLTAGEVLADLEREYSSAGLAVSSPGGESSDHASVELEFVSFLCGMEAEALGAEEWPSALEAICRQRRFLEEHLCLWVPSLAHAVSSREPSGLYALTSQAARTMAAHDVDFLGALAELLSVRSTAWEIKGGPDWR